MSKVRITFDQAGNVKADAIGFKGRACEAATDRLLAGLNSKTNESAKKPEFYQQSQGSDQVSERW